MHLFMIMSGRLCKAKRKYCEEGENITDKDFVGIFLYIGRQCVYFVCQQIISLLLIKPFIGANSLLAKMQPIKT